MHIDRIVGSICTIYPIVLLCLGKRNVTSTIKLNEWLLTQLHCIRYNEYTLGYILKPGKELETRQRSLGRQH